MFRRGNLSRFLLAASVLVLNGAIIVYLFERHAPRSNIHTLGESLW
jgi:voltage-gated potassium channel